jgi:hypothetical protein
MQPFTTLLSRCKDGTISPEMNCRAHIIEGHRVFVVYFVLWEFLVSGLFSFTRAIANEIDKKEYIKFSTRSFVANAKVGHIDRSSVATLDSL